MMRACVLLLVLSLSTSAAAGPKAPTVVQVFNAIDAKHRIKQTGKTWATADKIAATVDIRNGYLTFTDPKTKETTTAALWKASNGRWFFGMTTGGPSMSFWEADGADDTPEEMQPPPLPEVALDDVLAPSADAKLIAANAKIFPSSLDLSYELPRKGTTIIAHLDLAPLRKAVEDANLPAATKTKLRAIVDTGVFTRIELVYEDNKFTVGKTSKP
jgi:hypothetical protein